MALLKTRSRRPGPFKTPIERGDLAPQTTPKNQCFSASVFQHFSISAFQPFPAAFAPLHLCTFAPGHSDSMPVLQCFSISAFQPLIPNPGTPGKLVTPISTPTALWSKAQRCPRHGATLGERPKPMEPTSKRLRTGRTKRAARRRNRVAVGTGVERVRPRVAPAGATLGWAAEPASGFLTAEVAIQTTQQAPFIRGPFQHFSFLLFAFCFSSLRSRHFSISPFGPRPPVPGLFPSDSRIVL